MDNLHIYNLGRSVPQEACKTIQAGRLKGMTDINPMWRIKKMTEIFGVCGLGWYYEITKQWTELGADDVVMAFTNINLYIKDSNTNEWSKPIPGTGGSTFIAKETKGLYTSDECYKMALTDAISVACKALGVGADIYFDKDKTKYSQNTELKQQSEFKCENCGKKWSDFTSSKGYHYTAEDLYNKAKSKNVDNVARCKDCGEKLNTLIQD